MIEFHITISQVKKKYHLPQHSKRLKFFTVPINKFEKWQLQVNYKPFIKKLIVINNYHMLSTQTLDPRLRMLSKLSNPKKMKLLKNYVKISQH